MASHRVWRSKDQKRRVRKIHKELGIDHKFRTAEFDRDLRWSREVGFWSIKVNLNTLHEAVAARLLQYYAAKIERK